ncbi:short/branched chain specific acyl-CoA dehydrogenase, mitochondrial-like [Diabrotica virgifera virgifera]|uniref:Short/branched chain specific acyl-CoA dehydrogenase, mitochondrial n=1 Tax=Diabrotica virgifera virgifera TaxID=50390 RepID=A0A6P7FQK7_DIAVI|nr:short/branched chain specific acyl-CoA dehydrogenase, mitochondrial-like [Diabrotica virgifera virgifera]XP_050512728.1 short/branched chain specific acyl-CoA dehydrogenase, mitochondrial-like [Diabrotica virgifera virgifera]
MSSIGRTSTIFRRRPIRLQQNRSKHDYNEKHAPLTLLTEDENMLKDSVAKFSKANIAPYVREMENDGEIKKSVLDMCFQHGLMGVGIEEKYGGLGYDLMANVLVIEEIAKVDPAVSVPVDIHNTLINTVIDKLGTKEQKDTYLPRLAQDTLGSFVLSEPTSGSDAFAMKTTAKKDGSDYIINGNKMWISSAGIAGVFLVMANANPSLGYKGITCFIVERDNPGLSIGKAEDKLGICASGTHPVNLDNVRVPQTAIVGEVGQGYKIIAGSLNEGRIGVAAQQIGLAQGCLDITIPYTLERTQFNQPVYSFQGMQHQIAQIATEVECARLLTYNAARLVDNGAEFQKEASMAKYFAAEVAQKTCIKCIDWMGGVAFTKAVILEKMYRDVKIGSIYEGTLNMQLNTIAKCIEREYRH